MRKIYILFVSIILLSIGMASVAFYMGVEPRNRYKEYLNVDGGSDGSVSDLLTHGRILEEEFYSDSDKLITLIGVRTITWKNEYVPNHHLLCEILDKDTNELIATYSVDLNELPDNGLLNIYTDFETKNQRWYRICFYTDLDTDYGPALMIYSSSDSSRSSYSEDRMKNIGVIICEEERR